MIRYEILQPEDLPLAVEALTLTAARFPGAFSVGPFDDAELLEKRQVYVSGAEEVEAAQVLVSVFGELGVRWAAL